MNRSNGTSLENGWLSREFTAYNGIRYGPPTSAIPWGVSGCPLVPHPYRSASGEVLVPDRILSKLGTSGLTLADLGLDVWHRWDVPALPSETRQELMEFLYELPVPEEDEAIPGGVSIAWLTALPVNPRIRNALRRRYLGHPKDEINFNPVSCKEFLKIRQVGKTALIEMLCVLESVELGVDSDHAPVKKTAQRKVMTDAQFEVAVAQATQRAIGRLSLLYSRLIDFSAWALAETDTKTIGEAISWVNDEADPPAIWRTVADVGLVEISEPQRHPYDIIESWIGDWPDREKHIFKNRLAYSERRSTLQELAIEVGVTRERVRQIEKRLLQKFTAFTRKSTALPIRWRIETIRNAVGTAAPITRIEQMLSPGDDQLDYRSLLLRLAGPYDIDGDWVVLRSAVDNDPTEKIHAMADVIGFIDQELAERELTKWGIKQSYQREWLARDGRIRDFNGRLARWVGSIGDKLIIGLADLGRPATVDTLLEHIKEDRSKGSAMNALSGDDRVVRASRTDWALASWGLPEYSSIAMSIRNLVSNAGGPVHIDEVMTRIQSDFGGAESSIRAYCYAPMFVVEDGWINLRDDLGTFRYTNFSPRTARGVFALGPRRVSFMTEVNADLLRGSGRSIPLVVGAILDVPINQWLTFNNESGAAITVTYPETAFVGPTMGSARSLAESVGARLGEYLTIVLDRSEMSVTGTATSIGEHPPSWQLIARLTGIEASSGMKGLASALNCSEGEVRALLKSRGDDAVAQAIPAESSPSSALDEALSRLEAQLQQR